MPRKSRKRSRLWRFLHQPVGPLEKKMGILGTRGGMCGLISLVGGIVVTPWLRWFVLASVMGGVLLAWLFRSSHPEIETPPSILDPKI